MEGPVEKLISVDEVASLTGWRPLTIYKKAAAGEIPGKVKLGRSLRFKESAVEPWLEHQAQRMKGNRHGS
jgi:excisionase family DNA binding protein